MATFVQAGYELAVRSSPVRYRQVIEVYPHIAAMRLLNADYRVPYKVGRASQYWPLATPADRREKLLDNFERILGALREHIGGIPLEIPPTTAGPAEPKRFEDALDAVVCAWVGMRYLEGKCRSYGDRTAAVWIPTDAAGPR